jgi:predicted pyridoxine 5'-phosphate oxidase superfamily flavin-nucleotide-binding protein
MPRKFTQIAFTPEVKAAQAQRGSRETYARFEQSGPENDLITPELTEFIRSLDGFYLGTVGSNGYPYIQFRGGKLGFLQVLDEKTLGFPDFQGNVQYVSIGNLDTNDKAFLFLMDYRHRKRLKIWGRARYIEGESDWCERLRVEEESSTVERVILFSVEAWNWNCPQHIPVRYSEDEVEALKERIAELEEQIHGK